VRVPELFNSQRLEKRNGYCGLVFLPYQINLREFLLFDVAIGGIHLWVRDVIPLVLLAAALRLLLAFLGSWRRLDQPGDVRNMDRFYHIPLIGTRALEL
jgi:hypothetical protein